MKPAAIISLACVLLLVLNGASSRGVVPAAGAPSRASPYPGHDKRGHGGHHQQPDQPEDDYVGYSFYVFGDSFADTGNLLKKVPNSPLTRQWYPPYQATGRFSNAMVLSDFIAGLLGQPMSPPAHRQTRQVGRVGMNFAAGGSGAFDVPGTPTLGKQVHQFSKLVNDGDIKKEDLAGRSVALVAVDGNDYVGVTTNTSSADIDDLVEKVTAEIVTNVLRLQSIGVQKVLVNNLYPLGCAPWQTRPNNYRRCELRANLIAALHNRNLSDKLGGLHGVLLVDLSAAFDRIVGPNPDGDMVNLFLNRMEPCCESVDPFMGYCGQVNTHTGEVLYRLCENPDSHFFWDDMNPTQVGWEAVMGQITRPITEFLGISLGR